MGKLEQAKNRLIWGTDHPQFVPLHWARAYQDMDEVALSESFAGDPNAGRFSRTWDQLGVVSAMHGSLYEVTSLRDRRPAVARYAGGLLTVALLPQRGHFGRLVQLDGSEGDPAFAFRIGPESQGPWQYAIGALDAEGTFVTPEQKQIVTQGGDLGIDGLGEMAAYKNLYFS